VIDNAKFTEGYYESSDGLRLFYRDYQCESPPSREPVICLPGLTRNSRDFDALACRLSKRRRIITTDLRGRGRSDFDPDRRNYHPVQYVADVWELLRHLDLTKILVIGTSLGGWMAMIMAHERPAAVGGVVMNDIGPAIDPVGLVRVQASVGTLPPVTDWDEAVAEVKKHYEIAFPDWPDSKWLTYARATYAQSDERGLDIQLDRNVGVASREGVSGLRHDPWLLFEALVPIPLLVLQGEASDILSDATLRAMLELKPDARAAIVPNRGHAPYLDEPEALDAIERFIDDN
jgi:pimeloyl-ACP methyl ester carboxylesterase